MAEDPQPMTLQQRIAALNASHIGRVPGNQAPAIRSKPDTPGRRPVITKHHSVNIPQEQVTGTVTDTRVGNQPNGPPQLPSRQQPPPLPTRPGPGPGPGGRTLSISSTTSTSTTDTNNSKAAATRTTSNDNRVKAPAWGSPDFPVVTTRTEPERPTLPTRNPSFGQNSLNKLKNIQSGARQTLPPPLPGRKSMVDGQSQPADTPARKLPPMPSSASIEQAKKFGFSSVVQEDQVQASIDLPLKPSRPIKQSAAHIVAETKAPPIPLASRPDLAAIQATKPKFVPSAVSENPQPSYHRPNECMTCRDFSGPDRHAAQFPRQQVTSLADLGRQLTAPFTSLTDKARAIFTWLHFNVAYDVEAFFNNRIQPSTPQSTLQSGLAVCEGYAALFANIASHGGLEAVSISGDGKGYGYTAWTAGQPVPPFTTNHAWNAVKIDGGEWKLLDSCWGAGYVNGKGRPYTQKFNPNQFTMSNEEFGTRHFPSNKNQFFLPDGRIPSWEEYFRTDPDRWPFDCDLPTLFSAAKDDHAIGQRTLLPRERKIRVNAPGTIRFQFGLFCEHWTLAMQNKGPPPVFMLAIHGVDGRNRKDDYVPFEHVRGTTPGGGGDMWYLDIPARELGAPGQTLTLYAITTFGDRKNARGLTVREFLQGKGKVGMSFSGIAAWDLA